MPLDTNELVKASTEASPSLRSDPARLFENTVYADYSQPPQSYAQACDLTMRVLVPLHTIYRGFQEQGVCPNDLSFDSRMKGAGQMSQLLQARGLPLPHDFYNSVSSLFADAYYSVAKVGRHPTADAIDAVTRMFDQEGFEHNGKVSVAIESYKRLQESLARQYSQDSSEHSRHMQVAQAYTKTEAFIREMQRIYTKEKMDQWVRDQYPHRHNEVQERKAGQDKLRFLSRKQEAISVPRLTTETVLSTALVPQAALTGEVVARPDIQRQILQDIAQYLNKRGDIAIDRKMEQNLRLFASMDRLGLSPSGTWFDLFAGVDIVSPAMALTSGVNRVVAVSPGDQSPLYAHAQELIGKHIPLGEHAIDFVPLRTEQFLQAIREIEKYGATLVPVPAHLQDTLHRAVVDLRAGKVQGITINNPVLDLKEGAPSERGFSADGRVRTDWKDLDDTAAVSLFSFGKEHNIPHVSIRFSDSPIETAFTEAAGEMGYEKHAIGVGHYLFIRMSNKDASSVIERD